MTVEFFMKNLYSEDMEIEEAYIKDYTLVVRAVLSSHLELIANGYRPELVMIQKREFRFANMKIKSLSFSKPYKVRLESTHDNRYIISVSDMVLEIENRNIEIKKY